MQVSRDKPDISCDRRKGERLARRVSLALLLLLLSACAAAPEREGVRAAPPDISLPPLVRVDDEAGLNEHLIALTDKRIAEFLARGPEILIGLEGGEISAILGKPNFVRHDAPAEVWMYQSPSCHLDLFLYSGEKWHANLRDKEKKRIGKGKMPIYRVTFFEIRSRSVFQANGPRCLSSLLKGRRPA